MANFVPREKLSKKARKELDKQKRTTWAFSPVTKKVESKKVYQRKKAAHAWKDDSSMSGFGLSYFIPSLRISSKQRLSASSQRGRRAIASVASLCRRTLDG